MHLICQGLLADSDWGLQSLPSNYLSAISYFNRIGEIADHEQNVTAKDLNSATKGCLKWQIYWWKLKIAVILTLSLHKQQIKFYLMAFLSKWLLDWSFKYFNSSPHGRNGHHFADDNLICIFVNENICILIQNKVKFVPWCPIDNRSVLVQVMAWWRNGDKPLPEPMLTQLMDAYMQH